jgi:hypothetical protein
MALANQPLIDALRETAKRLREGAPYSWGNHGTCNCGNLLQVITELDAKEILRYAHTANGEWTELAVAHCEVTGAPVEMLISKLQEYGLTPSDIHCIEYLEDKQVLQRLEGGFRWLSRNVREDVIAYFETFADMLEEKLIMSMELKIEDILDDTDKHLSDKKVQSATLAYA